MTIWRVGQLAVCIDCDGPWINDDEEFMDGPESGDVLLVKDVGICPKGEQHLFFDEWPYSEGFNASEFRPAVQDWQSETQTRHSKLDDILHGRIPADTL